MTNPRHPLILLLLTLASVNLTKDITDDDSTQITSVPTCNRSYYDILYNYHKQCLQDLALARFKISNISRQKSESSQTEREELNQLRASLEEFKATLIRKKQEIETDYKAKKVILHKRSVEINIKVKKFNSQSSQVQITLNQQRANNSALSQKIQVLMARNVEISTNFEHLNMSYNSLWASCKSTNSTIEDKLIDTDKKQPNEGNEDIGLGVDNKDFFERRR